MATVAGEVRPKALEIGPDRLERFLGVGALVLLGFALTAIVRGRVHWAELPMLLWGHLATIVLALALTPILLFRRRGGRQHRILGTIWVVAMLATAILSLGVQVASPGHFTPIHLLSVVVLVLTPRLWWMARTHRVAPHRRTVRGLVIGALLTAGFFTFPFDRMLGQWLFG